MKTEKEIFGFKIILDNETDKGNLNKFICKTYDVDEMGDISLWSFGWQSTIYIILTCILGVLIGACVVMLGFIVFILPGFVIQCVIDNTLDSPITASTVIISLAAHVVIIAIILLIKLSMKVNVAHCPVKEESEHNEPIEKKGGAWKSFGDEYLGDE